MPVVPFQIAVPQPKIDRLIQKLLLTDFPDDVNSSEDSWARGVPLDDMKRLTNYWANQFSWRKAEAELNKLPQFIAQIDIEHFGNYDVHFVHQKSTIPNAIPLLFVHGWPSGFFEVMKLLPHLRGDGVTKPAFHVVSPSLIDFGFSSASRKGGFGMDQHAEAYHKLMLSLGYHEYVVQGGDLGYLIARFIALRYGRTHCKAHHINNAAPAEPSNLIDPPPLSAAELDGLSRTAEFSLTGNGYYRLASTRPQTIGYSLVDSPVGLLAWIYEKLHDWADPSYVWTDDEICTWVSIYWFSTPGPAASSRPFYENERRTPKGAFAAAQAYAADVPLGVARFTKDIVLLPRHWNKTLGPVVYESEYQVGGHFAAWERPDAIAKDLEVMFRTGGPAYSALTRM